MNIFRWGVSWMVLLSDHQSYPTWGQWYPQTLRIIRLRPEHVKMPVFSQSIVVFCRRFLTIVVAGRTCHV